MTPQIKSEEDLKTFDLAISFKSRYDYLARAIYEHFKDRLKVFYYKKAQDKLGGDDLLLKFETVFKYAKYTVAIIDKEYGCNGATKIEKDAIYYGNADRGWHATRLISMESGYYRPEWVPPGCLVLDFQTYGIDTTLKLIEGMLIDQNVLQKPETLMQLTKRLVEKDRKIQETKVYLNKVSGQVFQDAKQAARELMEKVKVKISEIEELSVRIGTENLEILCARNKLTLKYKIRYSDSIICARLIIFYQYYNRNEVKQDYDYYKFGADRNLVKGWISSSSNISDYEELHVNEYKDLKFGDEFAELILKNFIKKIYGENDELGFTISY